MQQHRKVSTDSKYLDLDIVQEYIKQDLDQNEYFRYEHDIDFDIPEQDEFFDCLDSIDEPPQIERFNQIKLHTMRISRKQRVEDELTQPPEKEDQLQLSIESMEEEFQYQDEMYDIKQIEIDKRKVISIFTLKQDYFDNKHNHTQFLKNVELLRQKNIHLEEFYTYIKELGLGCGFSLDQIRYELLQQFITGLVEIVKFIDDMFRFQSRWLEREPIITLQNIFQAFSFQWERFQDYTTALIDKSAISKIRSNNKIIDYDSLQFKKGIDFCLTQIDEQQNDGADFNIQQSNQESLILFKVFELLRLNEHFLHISKQNQKAKRIKSYFAKCRSRIKLYLLLKNKVKFQFKNKRKSQVSLHHNITEKYLFIDPNSIQLENTFHIFEEVSQPNLIRVKMQRSAIKNLNSNFNTIKDYDYYQ
ncbi:unnamed protein product (macronuclear) [Paramecium tetraurelia]|uniref:Spindle pole body component n=1 Tax=Paramecium tetraurelia TaxID=5888 RepID=A0CX88_PARTE|nr:uncharacterized protein GSPATT00001609001 [Paramecium tetraurelia]CAK75405.1 unnamed protein product [Paramecium tetraurelia]|eukprot:XP_001442802.1 hypothetical protein (macronuclear) [Paramecium tetraurelia strain d4-2]